MDNLFLQILNMSITSSYVILFVLAVRLLLKKAPKCYSYALWSVVLFRLCCPFSFNSIFALLPVTGQAVPPNIIYAENPQIASGVSIIDNAINAVLPAATPQTSINPMQIWLAIGTFIWLTVAILMVLYSFFTMLHLAYKLRSAKHISSNLYEMKSLPTAFVFGFIHPKIYLPIGLTETEKNYIIKHEETHIKRFDHLIKPFAFFVLCVHWFNPLVWVSFFMSSKDMELSCDESVIKMLGNGIKQDYSSSLLALSTGKRIVNACPLTFGENDTKARIKNVLNYKKPALWVAILSIIIVFVVSIGLLVNPVQKTPPQTLTDEKMSETEISTLADNLMREAQDVFWWYYSEESNKLGIDLEAETLKADGQEWQKVGRFKTMAELKSATESVFTLNFCQNAFYDLIDKYGKFKEIDGVLYHNGNVGGMGWIFGPPKSYTVQSYDKNKIVLNFICDGLNMNSSFPKEIEYEFELTLIYENGGWKVNNFYDCFGGSDPVNPIESNANISESTAFFLPDMDDEQQQFNQTYIRPLLLSGLLMRDWHSDNYSAISLNSNGEYDNALLYAFEDILGFDNKDAPAILEQYNGKFPEKIIDDVLLSHFDFTAEQLHKILSPYYKADEKIYTYFEEGRGGGPIESAVTGVTKESNGTITVEYIYLTNYYNEKSTSEKDAYLSKTEGTLTLIANSQGEYKYQSVKLGNHIDLNVETH